MHTRGFTLIELIVAVGAGALVALAAATAASAAAQCTSAANRLSLENGLMRAGFVATLDEVDSWRAYDDPDDASYQRLRGHRDGDGLAFTPLARTTGWQPSPERERARGFHPDEHWLPHDPSAWYRGHAAERHGSDLRFGRYAAVSNADASTVDGSADLGGASAAGGVYGRVIVPHAWRDAQLRSLWHALGYFGVAEYMPADTIYGWYQDWLPDPASIDGTNSGGLPAILNTPLAGNYRFTDTDGIEQTAMGLLVNTYATNYALLDPARGPATALAWLLTEDRRHYPLEYGGGEGAMREFRDQTEHIATLTPLRPSHWPSTSWSVDRYVKTKRFITLCRVRSGSALDGATTELNFTAFGTSLRGARRQRHRDGGWARWDDTPGALNDPTLDAPPAPWIPELHR